MKTLRTLLVDDSTMNRRILGDMLAELPFVEVVGAAGDGDEALRMAASLAPDVITLDLEMPRMDGFTFLRLLMASRPVPVIVVSSHSGKDNVFRALELGAIDFVAKQDALLTVGTGNLREQLREKLAMVRQLSPTSIRSRAGTHVELSSGAANRRQPVISAAPARLVVVAASTGGPTALLELFSRMPESADACILVAQHMPERFTQAFAERLDRAGPFKVIEASGEVPLRAGLGVVCQGGKCLEVVRSGDRLVAKIVLAAATDRYVPSADRLFRSAASAMGSQVCGVVLTGMGDDGAAGALAIKQAGGQVGVESAQTAVVHGMPSAAEQVGAARTSLPLPALADWTARFMRGSEEPS